MYDGVCEIEMIWYDGVCEIEMIWYDGVCCNFSSEYMLVGKSS